MLNGVKSVRAETEPQILWSSPVIFRKLNQSWPILISRVSGDRRRRILPYFATSPFLKNLTLGGFHARLVVSNPGREELFTQI